MAAFVFRCFGCLTNWPRRVRNWLRAVLFSFFRLAGFEIQGNGVGGLFAKFRRLFFGPELVDEQFHLLRFVCRRWVFVAEVQEVPEPFSVVDVNLCRDFPLLQNLIKGSQNIRWNWQHGRGNILQAFADIKSNDLRRHYSVG